MRVLHFPRQALRGSRIRARPSPRRPRGLERLDPRAPSCPKDLDSLLAWVACIADAQPIASYENYLVNAGFQIEHTEEHDDALLAMVNQIGMKLLGAEIMVGLKKLHLPGIDFSAAKQMAQAARTAVKQGALGYALLCGHRG